MLTVRSSLLRSSKMPGPTGLIAIPVEVVCGLHCRNPLPEVIWGGLVLELVGVVTGGLCSVVLDCQAVRQQIL